METAQTIHPFERAGLGKAPFRCTAVVTNWYSACPGHRQPGGSCDYCGTGIAYEYIISDSTGKTFKVGSDCVAKTHAAVAGFDKVKAEFQREKRNAVNKARREARAAAWAANREQWKKEREAVRMAERAGRYTEFQANNPELCDFLENNPERAANEFTLKMADVLRDYGSLTPGQANAVKSMMSRAKDRTNSDFIGNVGDRITGAFEIIATRSWESTIGWPPRTVFWTLLRMDGKHIVSYKGQCLGQTGEKFRAKFTVKEHETYQGTKQTKLQRPKMLDEVVAA